MNTNQQYHQQFSRFQQKCEKFYAPKFYKALREQYSYFVDAVNAGKPVTEALMTIPSQKIRMIIKNLYLDAGTSYGARVYASLPKIKKFGLFKGFGDWIRALINSWFYTGWIDTAESITETTRKLIQQYMTQAFNEGHGIQWIVDNLEQDSVDISRSRSRLIARTESVTACNQASFFAAVRTGLKMQKEWVSALDNRTRPDHANVHGQVVDMENYFDVGGAKLFLPGSRVQDNGLPTPANEVCNCRCVAVYLPVRDASGKLIEHEYVVEGQLP